MNRIFFKECWQGAKLQDADCQESAICFLALIGAPQIYSRSATLDVGDIRGGRGGQFSEMAQTANANSHAHESINTTRKLYARAGVLDFCKSFDMDWIDVDLEAINKSHPNHSQIALIQGLHLISHLCNSSWFRDSLSCDRQERT